MDSPIFREEQRHLRQITARALSKRGKVERYLVPAMFYGALLIAAALFGMELLAVLDSGFAVSLVAHPNTVLIVAHLLPSMWLIHTTIMFHFLLLLQVVIQSSGAILREKRAGTWELLLLTAQTPRQIVVGKWWAVILENIPSSLVLSGLRFGAILYLGLERYRINYFSPNPNPADPLYDVRALPFQLNVSTLLLGMGLVVLFTFANLLFTAAVGIIISVMKQSGNAVERAIATFVACLVALALPAALLLLGAEAIYNQSLPIAPPTTNFLLTTHLSALAISLVDNGTLATAAFLTAPRYLLNFVLERPYTQFFPPVTIPLALAFYALATAAALSAAIAIIRAWSD